MSKIVATRKIVITGPIAALLLALSLFSPAWAQTGSERPAEATKLHVILLVDGSDPNIGHADLADIAAMKHVIETTFAGDPNRVVYHDLTGKNPATGTYYTGSEVLGYVRGMTVGSNDNVLVYHSGHGSIRNRYQPEESQVLTIDGGRLNRKELMNAVLAHQPRGFIILTDCCSNFMDSPVSLEAGQLNVQTVRNLLLRPVGVVSITAAEDGTGAWPAYIGANPAQAGSAFTVAMTRLYYRLDVTYSSWADFFPVLRDETGAASGGRHVARAFSLGQTTMEAFGNLPPVSRR